MENSNVTELNPEALLISRDYEVVAMQRDVLLVAARNVLASSTGPLHGLFRALTDLHHALQIVETK